MRSSDSRLAWLNGKKVALISGGPSNEKDVSKRSAKMLQMRCSNWELILSSWTH